MKFSQESITLPSRDVLEERLSAVSQEPELQEVLFPALIDQAEKEFFFPDLVTVMGSALDTMRMHGCFPCDVPLQACFQALTGNYAVSVDLAVLTRQVYEELLDSADEQFDD